MGPVNIIFHEWRALWRDMRRAPDLKTALRYVLMPPGWSHDGRTMTSQQLRELARKKSNSKSVIIP